MKQLLRSRSRPLVVLQGPPGYAKTTCLALWDSADERQFCWVSCQSRHDDPALLVSAIVEALEPVELLDPEILLALSSPTPDLDTVIDRLVVALRRIPEPFVLVIDDVHRLTADGTGEVLESVFDSLPAGSQLAIGSRSRPPLPVGRIRAKRELLELGPRDLALTRRECAELLAEIGLEPDTESIDAIFERTEGWPAAIYLAGLALLSPGEPSEGPVKNFAGDDRVVVEYFRDEFFSGLSRERVQFLYRTSLLEELSGPLCDAALDRHDSARVLLELAGANMMVVPLDRSNTLFRYHHLFSDMLRSELHRREPDAEDEIHSRASRWYAANHEPMRAIDHAIASSDSDLAGELIWKAFPELSGRGQMATVDHWLEALGEERVRSSTPLMLALAHRELASGRGGAAAPWAAMAIDAAGDGSAWEAELHELKATLAQGSLSQMEADALEASRGLSPTSPWQASCLLFRGIAIHVRGDEDSAKPILREAARRGAIHSPIIQSLALVQLALPAIDAGRWDDASRFAGQARSQVDRCGIGTLGTMAIVFATSALVRLHEGRIEGASADLARCDALLRTNSGLPVWYEAELRLTLSRVHLRSGDFESASVLMEESSSLVNRLPDAPVLERWLGEVGEALDRARETLSDDGFNLTGAEVRTLRYLPSHHSFRAIGEMLNLSRNTVKTQAVSLYRKLGVNSRTDAVTVARRAGLLESPDEQAGKPTSPG